MPRRSRSLAILAALCGALLAGPAPAGAADYRPGEVVVRYEGADRGRLVEIRDGSTVQEKIRELERRPDVVSATPNWIARASAYIPNDPGIKGGAPGDWQKIQWNLLAGSGVNAPDAWDNLIRAGRPGASGVLIAVLDTGVAYRRQGRFRRSPDFTTTRFRKGYDFVDDDPYPLDHNGHGTHVTSTIAESANNGVALVGLAYGAKIMPVRVLDRLGEGDSVAISSGIRFAARNGADIINLSFEFGTTVTADQIPDILAALRYARRKGVLVVGASGNASGTAVAYPARASNVMSVGALTEHGCQAEYSNTGSTLDIAAPGGGPDAEIEDPNCKPADPPGRDIIQMTFTGSVRRFGLPTGYVGTSMAAPHVSAVAAMVVASGVIGGNPSPAQIEQHLKATARDLGKPGPDPRYGAGAIDAAAATAPPQPYATPAPPQPQP